MGQLTQTTAQVQVILDDADAANVGKTSLTDSTDTTAVAVRKSGFYSLGASSSNAPSTDRAILISAVRDTTATGEIRYGQVAITESNGMWWNRDDGGTLGTWYEAVSTAGTQTLTNKTLTSPVLTTPQINDTSANHQYVFAVSELVADRTVTLPLLTGNDTFVFEAHTQTLTNKTLTSPVLNTSVSGSAVLDEDDMSSNSATQLATQQSIKAYVDSQVTAQDLDFAGGSGTGSVDLDSQTFTIAGTANEIETAASSQTLTIGLPDSVTITTALSVDTVNEKTTAAGVTVDSLLIKDGGITAAGTSTFAGQTISDLGTVTTANIDGGSIDGTTIGASTAAAITGTTGQFNTSLNVDGTVTVDGLTVDTDTLVVDATNNRVGIGTSSPAELLVLDKSSGDTFVRFDKSGTFKGLVGISDSAGSGSGSAVAGDVILRSQTRVLLDTGGTTRAVVDASGRVGIGTSSPQFDLQTVNGGLDSRGTGSGIAIRNNVYFDSSDKYLTASGAASTQYFDGSGNIIFYNTGTASTGAGNAVSLSERMRIKSDGEVEISGIGNTAGARLNIGSDANNAFVRSYSTAAGMLLGTTNAQPLKIITNSVEAARFDANGNFGIGTSSPSYKLSLVDTTQVGTTIQLFRTGSAAGSMFINSGLAFGADGGNGDTQRMVISSSTGNVGIGTTSPGRLLEVNTDGEAFIRIRSSDSGNAGLEFGDQSDIVQGAIFMNASDNSLRFNGFDNAEAMRIASGGLLIGTTSTATASTNEGTYINGSGLIYSGRSGDAPIVANRITSDGNIAIFRKDGTTVGSISSTDNAGIIIGSHDVGLRFRQQSAGAAVFPREPDGSALDATLDLGISNSRFKDLYLSGDTFVGEPSTIGAGETGVTVRGLGQIRVGRSGTSSATLISFNNGNGEVGTITTSGSATAYNTSSDQRLKENIVDAPSASDDIDAIQVRSFDWKADGSHQKYGMIAQELQTVAPEAVSQPEDPEEMMGVDYSKLVPMMLKEIQQLRARVAQLEGAK